MFAAYNIYYNGTNWIRINSLGGWKTEDTLTFANNATHWAMAMKHGSAGTSAVTETDIEATTFEYVY